MNLNRFPAYTELVTHRDDEPVTGPVTAYEADSVVASAIRRGYAVEPTTRGVLVLRRPDARVVVELHPTSPPALTSMQAHDLALFAGRDAHLWVRSDCLVITAGIARIPPAATHRLLACGWMSSLTLTDGARVSVSVAGMVALTLARHSTRTSHPRGWHRAADNPNGPQVVGRDRHGGRIYDGTSTAVCSCRWSHYAGDRRDAARAAREHRQDSVLRALMAWPGAAVTPGRGITDRSVDPVPRIP
jgi:hypothetical protein